MELNKEEYLKKLSLRETKPGKVNNSEQALVLEIWHYFGKKISFGQLMTFIKRYGESKVYHSYNTVWYSVLVWLKSFV